jgi:hypothetical protein
MTIFLLIAMALLLVAALERTNRRQAPHPPGLHGSHDHDDRDWARIKLDLLALGDARPRRNALDRNGPRPA